MPPKIVYGRKATARPTSASYTTFLSPEKDLLLGTKEGVQAGKTGQRVEDELEALEAQLGGLAIDNERVSQKDVKKGHKSRRKALENRDANTVEYKRSEGAAVEDKAEMKGESRSKALAPTPPTTPPRTPIAKPTKKKSRPTTSKKAKLPTPEPTPERDDIYTQHVSPLLPYSDARKIIPFEQWSSELEPLFEMTKIAEASFSEVYRLSAISATTGLKEESVLKVVALKTPPGEPLPCQRVERSVREQDKQIAKETELREEKNWYKSKVADVLSEVKLLQNLNYIPGFTNFRDLTVLQGRPSAAFNKAWKAWNKERPRGKKSYFADPSKKTSYEDTQLWAVVEMQDAGLDCEKLMEAGGLSTIWEMWDVFWGVCLSIAKAEEACQFEHRDLHMGNICVRSSRSAKPHTLHPTIKEPLRRKFRFSGLETTVIDYTLSRADIVPHDRTASASITTPRFPGTEVAYLDLNADPGLFEGDAEEEYQYEIYRYMRGAALYNNALQSAPRPRPTKNTHIRFDSAAIPETPQTPPAHTGTDIWRLFHPATNLLWLHFLIHKLLAHLSRCGTSPQNLDTTQIMANVDLGRDKSVPGAALRVKRRAVELEARLRRVGELVRPECLAGEAGGEGAVRCARDLVVLGVAEGWLRVGDVSG